MPLFWRYKENYVNWKTPEKFRDFRETGTSNFVSYFFPEFSNKGIDESLWIIICF